MRRLFLAVVVMLCLAGCGSSGGTSTVTVNSPTCVQGYKVAGQVLRIVSNALKDAAKYTPLIEQAADAGLRQDTAQIDAIAARERSVNASITTLDSKLNALNNAFNPAPGGCS